ncbi:ABC transporter ATP-binding protein [Desulfobaculum senezii]|jgi:ABC-type Mn2+/Zn2+ transport system ATPase subunit
MTAPIIRMDNVSAAYGRHVAMHGVSLTVQRGDFLGIIGPNGAGKTTMLTVTNGMGRIAGGRVEVFGTEVTPRSARLLRKRIGYVAQRQDIDPLLPISVRESVVSGSFGRIGLFRRVPHSVVEYAEELLDMVGIGALAQRPLGHLSGGEQQRAAIARALVQRPDLLLLDEPTAALDWQAQREILELVRTIHTRFGLTSLIVTHDLNSLPDVTNRIAFMKDGRMVWQGTPRGALDEARLSELYGTPVKVATVNGAPHVCH